MIHKKKISESFYKSDFLKNYEWQKRFSDLTADLEYLNLRDEESKVHSESKRWAT